MSLQLVKHPVLCNYYVTYRCNASCSFCDIWEKPSSYINIENVTSNLLALKKLKVKVIDFTGGEPLLHRELSDFLSLAKKLGFITTITTNALLYPKRAKELKGKIDMLHFSLDSIDEQKHNASRNVDCYNHVLQSIEIAKKLGEQPDILFTVTPDNLHEIPEVHQLCLDKGLVLILNPIFDYNGIEEQNQFKGHELDTLQKYGKLKNVFLNNGFIKLRKDGGNSIENPSCFAGENTIVISPENELITPCYHLGINEFKIKDNLETLWESKQVVEERKRAGIDKACEGCTINCYMQPSFTTHINKYFWSSLPSNLKYNRLKGTWKQLFG